MIPPASFPTSRNLESKTSFRLDTNQHHIACLFTSTNYGKNVSSPEIILRNTASALRDLEAQVSSLKREKGWKGEIWAVRINSGRFGVVWSRTRAVLENGPFDITVVRPENEDEPQGFENIQADGNGGCAENENENEGEHVRGGDGNSLKRKALGVVESGGDTEQDGEKVNMNPSKRTRTKELKDVRG